MTFQLITEIDRLERLYEPWRELAHTCACPAALPGWQLAWWRHLAPEGALLRAVAVFEQDRLVGLAPFFVNPGRRVDYRLLGAGITHRLSPLALPGRERETACFVAHALADSSPRPDLVAFEGIDATSPWPDVFVETWPGRFRPWRYTSSRPAGPAIDTAGVDFEAWFSSRSRHFRKHLRVAKRRADEIGARTAPATSKEAYEKALLDFRRLHLARWEHRGGSTFDERTFEMIKQAARVLVPANEMRVVTLETAQDTVAVMLALAAGGEMLLFSYGFDERYARISPIHLTVLAAVEDAFRNGYHRVDFGRGTERHKQAFANSDAPVSWGGLVIRSRRYPLTRARLAPQQFRWLAQRLARRYFSSRQRARIKRLAGLS